MKQVKKNIGTPEKLRIIFSGGGTGGHLFPAIAIASGWKAKYPDSAILFVGSKGKMEMQKIPLAGFEIKGLWIDGFHRGKLLRNLLLPFKVLSSLIQSFFILKKFKPDIIVGTGGYASFPLIFTGARLGIPSLIQEQNYFPGITNKYLSKYAQVACTVSESVKKYFPKSEIVVSGNPVREKLLNVKLSKQQAIKHFGLDIMKKTIFVTGGSLGAGTINKALLKHISLLTGKNIQLIWQTGNFYYDFILNNLDDPIKNDHYISAFLSEMELAYKAADIVIARAGAITLSELAIMGKASILIPSPNVAEDHQTKNAMSLIEENAAEMIRDNHVETELPSKILSLINQPGRLKQLEQNIQKFARPRSVEIIIKEMEKLVKIS